jgi:hypothetical protein
MIKQTAGKAYWALYRLRFCLVAISLKKCKADAALKLAGHARFFPDADAGLLPVKLLKFKKHIKLA